MLVSVVVAVHNGAAFVGAAIDSVLAQEGVALELVVVDDGSTDATSDILAEAAARDPRVTILLCPRRGVSCARNAGLARTTGELIAFLDADDVFLPGKLRRQSELFAADPDLAMALTSYVITDAALEPRRLVREVDLRRWALLDGEGPLAASTAMVRRAALASDLRFDERFSTVADIEFALRAARAGGVKTLHEPLTQYRCHNGQMHRQLDVLHAEYPALADVMVAEGLITAQERRLAVANFHVREIFRPGTGQPFLARLPGCVGGALRNAPTRLVTLPLRAAGRRAQRRLRSL